jgi:hypothetical protein
MSRLSFPAGLPDRINPALQLVELAAKPGLDTGLLAVDTGKFIGDVGGSLELCEIGRQRSAACRRNPPTR